jgi:hypothetical protein
MYRNYNQMKKILTVLICGMTIIACSKSDDPDPTNGGGGGGGGTLDCGTVTTKSYATDISPIVQSKCATNSNCHGSGSSNGPGELTTYQAIFDSRTSIRSAVGSGTMPKEGTITAAQKNSILCWVDSGAPNN